MGNQSGNKKSRNDQSPSVSSSSHSPTVSSPSSNSQPTNPHHSQSVTTSARPSPFTVPPSQVTSVDRHFIECSICHAFVVSNEHPDHMIAHELEREEEVHFSPSYSSSLTFSPSSPSSTMTHNPSNPQIPTNARGDPFPPFPFPLFLPPGPVEGGSSNGNIGDNSNGRDEAIFRFISELMRNRQRTPLNVQATPGASPGLPRVEFERMSPFPYHAQAGAVDTSCPICLIDYSEGEDIILTPCFHKFHTVCLWSWAKEHPSCPVCKRSLQTM